MAEYLNLSTRQLIGIVAFLIILILMFFVLSGAQPGDIFKVVKGFITTIIIYLIGGLKQILHG